MNSRFDQLTKGLLSLTVILMFTVALIAGQARANLPADDSMAADFGVVSRTGILLDAEALQRIQSLPYAIDPMLALPVIIELGINNKLTPGTGDAADARSDDTSVQ